MRPTVCRAHAPGCASTWNNGLQHVLLCKHQSIAAGVALVMHVTKLHDPNEWYKFVRHYHDGSVPAAIR